jgi:hypothetical protein
LKKLSGQSRVNVWKSPDLVACALAGPIDAAPESFRSILFNKDGEYKRRRAVAVINASDVNDPEDLQKDGASCFIKMSSVSVEALRRAFLDPESRIRLNTDPQPEPHAEFVAVTWEGGFLMDTSVHFNENLNVLVGGRGASTPWRGWTFSPKVQRHNPALPRTGRSPGGDSSMDRVAIVDPRANVAVDVSPDRPNGLHEESRGRLAR